MQKSRKRNLININIAETIKMNPYFAKIIQQNKVKNKTRIKENNSDHFLISSDENHYLIFN